MKTNRLECTVRTAEGHEIAVVVLWSQSFGTPNLHKVLRRRYGALEDVTATPFERTYYPQLREAVLDEMEARDKVERDAIAEERADEVRRG